MTQFFCTKILNVSPLPPLPGGIYPPGHAVGSGEFAAWALLACVLRESFGVFTLPRVERAERGKPFFPERGDIFFSLSHTKTHAACAVSDKNVGTDIETVRPLKDGIQRRVLASGEEEYFTGEDGFFRLWTLKESYIKYLGGEGLNSYKDMRFIRSGGAYRMEGSDAVFRSFDGISGCAAAMCAGSGPLPDKPEEIPFEKLLTIWG